MTIPAGGAVLPVDKPVGPTSHDVVGQARRALGLRRIGHTGTLDPFASGLLLLCLGPATRIAEYLSGLDKEYIATARLGETTATDDLEGDVMAQNPEWRALRESDVAEGLQGFLGELAQVPPQYSAKKVAGEAMHRRARRGEHVELEASAVTVHEIELLEVELPSVRFRLRCSSGTYVRAIARDLGEALGVGGHLTALRRTAIARFDVADGLPVVALSDADEVAKLALTPLEALSHLPGWSADAEAARRITHGQSVPWSGPEVEGPIAVAAEGELLAVGHAVDGLLKPNKVFQ